MHCVAMKSLPLLLGLPEGFAREALMWLRSEEVEACQEMWEDNPALADSILHFQNIDL